MKYIDNFYFTKTFQLFWLEKYGNEIFGVLQFQ